MMRDVVAIDRGKCTGCGACVGACAEGAIQMVDGKAMLVREDHCDGLGACLPECPAGAISIVKKEAEEFVGTAVPHIPVVCPGQGPGKIVRDDVPAPDGKAPSRLGHWPVQLRLVNASAPYFGGCDLLVSADCCAYALGSFHEDFIKGRVCVIGCPKLDPPESWDRLTDILKMHDVRSITVTKMEVPCCNAAVKYVEAAVGSSGKDVPVKAVTVRRDGTPAVRPGTAPGGGYPMLAPKLLFMDY